ncbi:hypothetical protein [Fibrobacter sp. UWB11]|uniref:hypothetical protein n=1 Tax=Fibrobacter sp. UWB11 TaxID=1896202 RepID=UPI00092CA558|nr:hypothetical protein [Fibrobacter sp. UWB11]SIN96248.1 hypothetical protein SAMN05720758_0773 [Fibrobacter sp. UWB11]
MPTEISTTKVITKTYNFKETHIYKFKLINNTTSFVSIQPQSSKNAVEVKSKGTKTYTLKNLAEGEEYSVCIEKTVKTKKRTGDSKKFKTIKKRYRFILNFIYSKFSKAHALVKVSDIDSLQETEVIQNKELDFFDKHLRYVGFHNSGVYAADFIISYKEKESDNWIDKKIDYFNAGRGTDKCTNQKDYPNKVYDLQKAGIPAGYLVTVKVSAKGGIGSKDNARSSAVFVYHPESNRVAQYKCSGTSCLVKINNPKAAEFSEPDSKENHECDEPDFTNHLRYVWFHNGSPYQADFIISYKEKESDNWIDKKIDYFNAGRGTDKCNNQKDYPNKVYDLQKAGIPKGYWVTVKTKALGGIGSKNNARSSTVFRYHPESHRVTKYKTGGTSCNVKIIYEGEYNLQ